MGKKTPKTAQFSWDLVTLPEEDRATAIDNMLRKIGEDRASGYGDILADKQTDKHTHTDVLITILQQINSLQQIHNVSTCRVVVQQIDAYNNFTRNLQQIEHL